MSTRSRESSGDSMLTVESQGYSSCVAHEARRTVIPALQTATRGLAGQEYRALFFFGSSSSDIAGQTRPVVDTDFTSEF